MILGDAGQGWKAAILAPAPGVGGARLNAEKKGGFHSVLQRKKIGCEGFFLPV